MSVLTRLLRGPRRADLTSGAWYESQSPVATCIMKQSESPYLISATPMPSMSRLGLCSSFSCTGRQGNEFVKAVSVNACTLLHKAWRFGLIKSSQTVVGSVFMPLSKRNKNKHSQPKCNMTNAVTYCETYQLCSIHFIVLLFNVLHLQKPLKDP